MSLEKSTTVVLPDLGELQTVADELTTAEGDALILIVRSEESGQPTGGGVDRVKVNI